MELVINDRSRLDRWRWANAAMTPEPVRLDFGFVRKALRFVAVFIALLAPFSRDPMVTVACGLMPMALVAIVDHPRTPSVVVYYLLYMWLEMAARLVLTAIDGEALGEGLYGYDTYRAMWYAMANLLVLATVLRLCLNRLPVVPGDLLTRHLQWPPWVLFNVYLAAAALSFFLAPIAMASGGLSQPIQALGALKYVVMFALFSTVMSTGNGYKLLLLVVLAEIAMGFTGLFSGFKTVLIVLLLTALSVRIQLRMPTVVGVTATVAVLLGLGVFWTAVKSEYREMATGYSDSQTISASFAERASMLVGKATRPGELEWTEAVDQLVRRIAYIDFFGATIGVVENAPEDEGIFPRWRDALEHVAKPRFLFPDKAVLDDTEIFLRYVRDEIGDDSRPGTSISIGFLAENFIDFGFPGMLVPMAVMALLLGRILRYLMTRAVPWVVSEGFIMAMFLTLGAGMELSLAKFLGGTLLTFAVLAICLKFAYPPVQRWIERSAASRIRSPAIREDQEEEAMAVNAA